MHRRQNTDLNIGFRVKGVVDDNFLGTRNFLPQLCFQLGGCCEPVETGGYQQRHPNLRIPLPELRQHGGQDVPAGHGAGVVGNDDGTALLPRRESGQVGVPMGDAMASSTSSLPVRSLFSSSTREVSRPL